MITNNTKITITLTADEAKYILDNLNNSSDISAEGENMKDSIRKKISKEVVDNFVADEIANKLYRRFRKRKVI